MYRALTVARYIIQRCALQKKHVSNLKLQKILYFVQAEFLVSKDCECFGEEIEAWDFGPVVPVVYHRYKIFGGADIPALKNGTDVTVISREDQELINGIVDECARYSTSTLVEITHRQRPWKDAYFSGYNRIITKEAIKKYFAEE